MSVVARIVPSRTHPSRAITQAEIEERRANKLKAAPAGNCPKCGGIPLLLGTRFSEDLPRQCFDCGHKYEVKK